MNEFVIGLLIIVFVFIFSSGIFFLLGGKDIVYEKGYECATLFHSATTRADSLQIQLDGCDLVELK